MLEGAFCWIYNCVVWWKQVEHVLPFLRKGIGIHHSGLLPLLKETIEILFSEGLIKVCHSRSFSYWLIILQLFMPYVIKLTCVMHAKHLANKLMNGISLWFSKEVNFCFCSLLCLSVGQLSYSRSNFGEIFGVLALVHWNFGTDLRDEDVWGLNEGKTMLIKLARMPVSLNFGLHGFLVQQYIVMNNTFSSHTCL